MFKKFFGFASAAAFVLAGCDTDNSTSASGSSPEVESCSANAISDDTFIIEVVAENVIIPDYDEISPVYKESIKEAYKYGITSGMDDAHTFAPKSLLTRAQICQLFYNLGWTTIE